MQFVGFAIPGTLSSKTKKVKKIPDPNLNQPTDSKIALKLSDIPIKQELVSKIDDVIISENVVEVPTKLIENFTIPSPKKTQTQKKAKAQVEILNGDNQNQMDSKKINQTKQKVRKRVKVRF